MNADKLLKHLKDYYGEFKNGKNPEDFIKKYIEKEIDPDKLAILMKYILLFHPINYGMPGIADIEICISKAIKANKGVDVHFVNISKPKEYTEEELLEFEKGRAMLKKAGGFKGLLKNKWKEEIKKDGYIW